MLVMVELVPITHASAAEPVVLRTYRPTDIKIINSPNGLFKQAPNSNGGAGFYNWFRSAEGRQKRVQSTGQYVPDAQ